jgi:hypothetical protein
MSAYIYCLTHPCIPDYCKVGETSKSLNERLRGLNNTSVPSCFFLEYYICVNPNYRFKIESAIHQKILEKGERIFLL